jgi:hypothetical protein
MTAAVPETALVLPAPRILSRHPIIVAAHDRPELSGERIGCSTAD